MSHHIVCALKFKYDLKTILNVSNYDWIEPTISLFDSIVAELQRFSVYHLKSVHFKNTVARSSVLSKLCSFSIIHLADFVLISADLLLKIIIILVELRIAQLCS